MAAWMLTSPGQALEAYRMQTRMASLAGCQLASMAGRDALEYGQKTQEPGLPLVEALDLPSQLCGRNSKSWDFIPNLRF